MSAFVLVHGAWRAPASPAVGLGTHIQDIVALIEAYDLTDVVLVGASYAGQVVTGVADRVPARVAMRVYLDAFAGDDGDAAIQGVIVPPAPQSGIAQIKDHQDASHQRHRAARP
jgi:pimeloyl-ACP methyl ester carboxylesterase